MSELDKQELERLRARVIELEATVKQLQTAKNQIKRDGQETLENLYNIFRQAPMPIGITKGAEHVFELVNAPFEEISPNRQLVGSKFREVYPELESQGFFAVVDQIYETGEPFYATEYPVTIVRPDGTPEERFFNFVYQPLRNNNGAVEGILQVGFEITNQVKALRATQVYRERLELAQRAGNIGTYEWFIPANYIIWTPELEAMYGLPPGGFEGKYENWARRVHPDDLTQAEESLQAALNGGAPFSSEFRVVWENGQTRWLLAKGDLYLDENGKPYKLVGVNIDITERKLAQIELNDFRDQFLSMVSHDLRTPLTSIKGFAELLKRNFQKELRSQPDATNKDKLEKQGRQAESILVQTVRMNEMIDHLLEYSRLQQGKLELDYAVNTDIVGLIAEIVEAQKATITDHTLVLQSAEPIIKLNFDKLRIEQVLNNLINNALKYSPSNTTVTVAITPYLTQDEVVVSIRDEGYGIPKEQQSRLFERFYRVQTEQTKTIKGTGLGLYISSQIVKHHGGRIWFESELGKGSIFYFALPLSKYS